MLVRLPGNARHTSDVDLMTSQSMSVDEALVELDRALANDIDPLRFTRRSTMLRGMGNGARVVVDVTVRGTVKFHTFHIDLVVDGLITAAVESVRVRPVIEVIEFAVAGTVRLVALSDQIADKLCALYERPGANTRVRDLVDLLLISLHFDVELARTVEAIRRQLPRRAGLVLPAALVCPNDEWKALWLKNSEKLPGRLHGFDDALACAAVCFSPILAAVADVDAEHGKVWSCVSQSWADAVGI